MEKKLLNEINEIKSMMGLVVEQPEVEEYKEFTSDFKDIPGADEYGDNAKFKVTSGGENATFNEKKGYNGAIITPKTTITLPFGQGGIRLSGMGEQIKIDTTNKGLKIIKDVA